MEKINIELVENLLHKTELVIITKQTKSYIGKLWKLTNQIVLLI